MFLLEHADGSPDPVDAAGLVELLRPARRRVKLAVVSACQSAADATAETLRLVGLTDQADTLEAEAAGQVSLEVTGLARSLVRELECAVVAMRYPVTDEFAIAFGEVLYEHLLSRRQPVDVAAARAVARAAGAAPSAARPAASLATPGIFGARASGLTLAVPRGKPFLDPAEVAMAFFPPEPERFVGRAAAMAAASAALASGSGRTVVLLHGMAGAGKTSCAVELAYRHQDSFAAAAFWQAPTRQEEEFGGALASLAIALEAQLGRYGFTMAEHITTAASLAAFLPRLRKVLEASGVLLVLDNLETLLTPDGAWRDPRWGPLVAALSGHGGEARMIVTSRVPPAGLGLQTLVLPVHALSLGEAAALARELPHLHALLHEEAGPVRGPAAAGVDADRERVRRVLRVVQGHPKLLELADAAAADRDRLDAQLSAAETAAAGQELEAFFRDGTSTLDPDEFLAALTTWTTTALTVLPPAARLLAQFLACLEDPDRVSPVIQANWGGLWRRLELSGSPPSLAPLLETLTTAALIQADKSVAAAHDTPQAGGGQLSPAMYRMHPGVAAAIAADTAPEVRAAVDILLGAFWDFVADQAPQRGSAEDSALIVRAGLGAVPYLLRRRDWDAAGRLLEWAIVRDESPGTVQASLPALRQLADATRAPEHYANLARALRRVDPAEAGRLLDDVLRDAADGEDYQTATAAAGGLASVLAATGRPGEALDLIAQKTTYTAQAGLGPWNQLGDQVQRLQVLVSMGKHRQVLAETRKLRARMSQLPARPGSNDTFSPWQAREAILDTAHTSALALEKWQLCLHLNAEILSSRRQRAAGVHEIICTRFNDGTPLIGLGRLAEAGQLLHECQQVFEDHRDITQLAKVFTVRADLEDELGHRDTAVDLQRTGLRLSYVRPDPRDIAPGHHNLAIYLRTAETDPAAQRAHLLAAALVYRLTGITYDLANTQRALAHNLYHTRAASGLPATVAEVIQVTGQTEGVHLGELITSLQPDLRAVEDALAEILRAAVHPSIGLVRHGGLRWRRHRR